MAAQVRKYDALPDLDSAPDTYETPAIVGENDNTTEPSSPSFSRTGSSSKNEESQSSSEESPDGAPRSSRVDSRANRPANARGIFSKSRVDARGVDFSDRITNGRKSYRVRLARRDHRRRREKEGGGYVDVYEEFSDEEELQESFAERVARLRREIEEVKVEEARIASEGAEPQADGHSGGFEKTQGEIRELSELLNALHTTTRSVSSRPIIGTPTSMQRDSTIEKSEEKLAPQANSSTQDAQLVSNEELDRILLKATNFEARLTALEAALGVNTSSFNSDSKQNKVSKVSVLSTLAMLETQVSTLSDTTIPTIESMSTQIDQLTADATKLEEARSAARAAQEALATKSPGSTPRRRPDSSGNETTMSTESMQTPQDAEQVAKINSLYGALSSIESMSSILPSVLDRLKSLRVLHSDAAVARENLDALEKTQARVGDEIRQWREGLEQAERAFKESDEAASKNSAAVQAWINDLAKRLDAFDK